ncbi:MAG: tRNA (adenosine(37)-N6)-threonylcarbamoyltransferase complex transferase subunit TsaD, partial [Pigmentiphaga sp.]|nr:tRNA (adenosine(37)-N6)-threonylcarbamoyltransferase complex transferase subunit TsaD [Pigmentiphaga sp.]
LGYPGGPALSKLAESGNPERFDLPRPKLHGPDLDFSFSGLKTAVLTRMKTLDPDDAQARADLAAATQDAIVSVLVAKSVKALEATGLKRLVIAGGVGANKLLRQRLAARLERLKAQAFFPPLELCTDNGAMIAFAAALRLQAGLADPNARHSGFTVQPRWDLGSG